ncbi:MAG: indolepyruvate ferredoxin oxidoreductase subunit alpha [Thermoanaerobacterales bacterium]|jgi:indolepyruvate ferredoxin oxidoreductase alpha subunit|nr:indolepyruvate ferredoxin oxidoreductase subunit alpha [Thermoanaerobacterales bacterium]
MKRLMTGNEAIARGAYEAGCSVAAAYPGTPSTEILENIANYKHIYSEWSINEKVALEMASGASIAGARALVAMKHVGLNVAADPLFTMAYEGVNGGLVIVTADDPGLHSSQNEQDNRLYALHAKVAMIEPSDSGECLDYIKFAFELSERFDIPVMFRVTTRVCHGKSIAETGERFEAGIRDYEKNIKKHVMIPAFAKERHQILEQKLLELREFSNKCRLNKIEWGDKKIGVITSGISYHHTREVLGENASFLKIGLSHPLPDKLITEFAKEVETLYIIEEGEPYIETHVKSLGIDCIGKQVIPICGELNPEIIEKAIFSETNRNSYEIDISIPQRPPVLCAGCPHRTVFYALSMYKDVVVTGDIGCYSLGCAPPLNVTDTLICMGAGISAGIGFEKATELARRGHKVFGCIGDSTFLHSGITGLVNAVYNKSKMAVLILDNRTTAMTGHQENPGTGRTLAGEETVAVDLEAIVKAVGVKEQNVRVIDPYDLKQTKDAIKAAYDSNELFVIIAKRPCVLKKDVRGQITARYKVDYEKCKKCKACINTGCPAIAVKDGSIVIDDVSCNGCSLCKQVCRFGAIVKVGE